LTNDRSVSFSARGAMVEIRALPQPNLKIAGFPIPDGFSRPIRGIYLVGCLELSANRVYATCPGGLRSSQTIAYPLEWCSINAQSKAPRLEWGTPFRDARAIEQAEPQDSLARGSARNVEIFTRLAQADPWGCDVIPVPRVDVIRSRWST